MNNLAQRYEVAVTVVDVPRGHGRSELFRRTFANSSTGSNQANQATGRELFTTISGPISSARSLMEAMIHLVSPGPNASQRLDGLDASADLLLTVFAEAAKATPLVIAIDDSHRGGPEALNLLAEIATRLPPNVHLVLGGTGLGSMQLGELALDNRLRRLGPEELPLKLLEFPDTYETLFREALAKDVDSQHRRLLGALIALRITDLDVCRHVTDSLGLNPEVLKDLTALPGIVISGPFLDMHEEWGFAARTCNPQDRRSAGKAAGSAILRSNGDPSEAARIAIEIEDADLLKAAVRQGLSVQPSNLGAHHLRTWQDSGLLRENDAHTLWVSAASAAAHGADLEEVFRRFEAARLSFGESGDFDAEMAIGISSAMIARRRNDLLALITLVQRAQELVLLGCEAARPLARSGEALAKQMDGDAAGALEALNLISDDSVGGDWAAQVHMMRSLNLLLLGRLPESIDELVTAAGFGGPWSYVVTLDQLAFARWRSGDAIGALKEIDEAERLATQIGTTSVGVQVRALQAVIYAACGGALARSTGRPLSLLTASPDPEAQRLHAIAGVLTAIQAEDYDGARTELATIDAPKRAVRSTSWTLALQVALEPQTRPVWAEVVGRHRALGVALEAGDAGAVFLREGKLAPATARPFLPWSWCVPTDSALEVSLIGGATVHRNGVSLQSPLWDRLRVRELCLCLAVVESVPRDRIIGWLWPELSTSAAQRNLRVTLTYLLDVLDPQRRRGAGSLLISDAGGLLSFAQNAPVSIDLRNRAIECAALLRSDAAGDQAGVLAAARRLVRYRVGPILGGTPIGEWFEPFEIDLRETLIRALTKGARSAANAGDTHLATELARLGLEEDPWGERLHMVLIEALLRQDDLDGARRAMRRALDLLLRNGLEPEMATRRLARNLGVAIGTVSKS